MIPDQYPNCYKVLEIYTGYFDSLDIMILFFLSQRYHNNERLLFNKEQIPSLGPDFLLNSQISLTKIEFPEFSLTGNPEIA